MKTILALILITGIPGIVFAQVSSRELSICDSKVRVEQRVVTTAQATQFFSTGTVGIQDGFSASSQTYVSSRKWVEVWNLNPSTAAWIFISTFSTTNRAYGIPVANSGSANAAWGGPNSARFPWGPNIPVWVTRRTVAGVANISDVVAVSCE